MSIIKLKRARNIKIKGKKIIKNSGIIDNSLIEYINESFSEDFVIKMKKGYEDMAELNLEYAEIGCEYMLEDVNEYEAWICGV